MASVSLCMGRLVFHSRLVELYPSHLPGTWARHGAGSWGRTPFEGSLAYEIAGVPSASLGAGSSTTQVLALSAQALAPLRMTSLKDSTWRRSSRRILWR